MVGPWPFETGTFRVFYEYRVLADLSYADPGAFRKALDSAPVCQQEILIRE